MTENTQSELKSTLLSAILPHVAFDGWSDPAFQAACDDSEIDINLARLSCPRGALAFASKGLRTKRLCAAERHFSRFLIMRVLGQV